MMTLTPTGMTKGAILSQENPRPLYRYRLWRVWGDGNKRVVFVGINPSTADAKDDDPTIRKEIGFAQRWGFGALDKVNLFGWRDTDQCGLLEVPNPVGVENDCRILQALDHASLVVLCWGRGKTAAVRHLVDERVRREQHMLYHYGPAERVTLGTTDDGYPRHPLMLAYSTPLEPGQR
jgi:hypothetical protein